MKRFPGHLRVPVSVASVTLLPLFLRVGSIEETSGVRTGLSTSTVTRDNFSSFGGHPCPKTV